MISISVNSLEFEFKVGPFEIEFEIEDGKFEFEFETPWFEVEVGIPESVVEIAQFIDENKEIAGAILGFRNELNELLIKIPS
jgi:hypothetical protein